MGAVVAICNFASGGRLSVRGDDGYTSYNRPNVYNEEIEIWRRQYYESQRDLFEKERKEEERFRYSKLSLQDEYYQPYTLKELCARFITKKYCQDDEYNYCKCSSINFCDCGASIDYNDDDLPKDLLNYLYNKEFLNDEITYYRYKNRNYSSNFVCNYNLEIVTRGIGGLAFST